MDFEEFKKYHNANYHDGDSTFDELNYKKSNGDDFDNEFVQDCFDHFEAGQQSKQAEIDALQEKISKVLYAISQSELHGDRAVWGIQDEIKEILK